MNQKDLQTQEEYRTNDIYLSAFLISRKYSKLLRIEPSDVRRKTFIFSPVPDDSQIQAFYARDEKSKVPARDLFEELRNLKSMIMNQGG